VLTSQAVILIAFGHKTAAHSTPKGQLFDKWYSRKPGIQ